MPKFLVFDVSLSETPLRIWRRFMLVQNATFGDLHHAIQDSMGWEDRHAWGFGLPNGYSLAALLDEEGERTDVGSTRPLTDYFTGEKICEWCEYRYDFGDDWLHEIRLLDLVDEEIPYKRMLIDGDLSCPPEDCGGIPGYENIIHFLETGRDEAGADPKSLKKWLGKWEPDGFDAEAAAAAFAKGRSRSRKR